MLKRGLLIVSLLLGLPAVAEAAVFYPTTFTLENGLQVVVVPNHLAPAVNQMVWYKVGSTDEVSGKTGLAHYLEHLMFRGTTTMAPGEFSKIIASQGGEDNAFTSYDYTSFHETVAVDRLEMIMKMEADRMQNLNILPATATPELSVVLNERQQRTDNSPEGRFSEKARQILMPHYPYGVPVIGWRPEIEKLTAADATAFYQRHYAPNNAVVVISGDVNPDDVKRLAEATYGQIPKHEVDPAKVMPPLPYPSRHQFVMVDAGVEQPQLEMQIVSPSYTTQTGREAYALEVLNEALDSGEIGLLYRKLVEEKALASGVGIDYDPDTRANAVFTIALSPRPGVAPQKLAKALSAALKDLAKTGLTDQDVTSAKQRLEREAIFARDSLMMPGYAFGMALTTGHSVEDVEAWPDRIEAVTPADVTAALRALVANKHKLVAMLLPDPHATKASREAARPVMSHDVGIR